MSIPTRFFLTAAVVLVLSSTAPLEAKPLNLKQKSFLQEQAIPAYRQGATGLLLEPLAKFVSGLDEQGRAEANELLSEKEVPPLAHLLLSARMAKVQQGGKLLEPRPNSAEILLLLPYLKRELAALPGEVNGLPALAETPPRPEQLKDYEAHFWDLDRADGTLRMGQFFAREARKLQEMGSRLDRAAVGDEERAALDADFDSVSGKLASLRRQVVERALRLRLQRLEDSVAVLENSKDTKSRWRAAYFVDSDGGFLSQVFQPANAPAAANTDSPVAEFAKSSDDRVRRGGNVRRGGVRRGGQVHFAPKTPQNEPVPDGSRKSSDGSSGVSEVLATSATAGVKSSADRFGDSVLNDPQLAATVRQQVNDGLKAAGELTAKTRMLHAGLSWWLRGRYGRGSHFMGLIKSPAALNSPAALFAVAMPSSLPAASDPSNSSLRRSPTIRRRHHQIWAWEERTVQIRSSYIHESIGAAGPDSGYLAHRKGIVAKGDLSFFRDALGEWSGSFAWAIAPGRQVWGIRKTDYAAFDGVGESFKDIEDRIYDRTTTLTKTYLPSERTDIVKRIVGFVEYAQALDYFDRLLATTNPQEQKVIDELIAENDRYAVYTNLSRLIQKGRTSLGEAPSHAQDDFKRTGLAWVMGVARVELAAMLSAFAHRDDAFSVVLRNNFGADEYKELVQDGMRTHLATLQQDPFLRRTLSDKAPVNRMLAYLRRVSLAKQFVKAAAALSQNQYTSLQWSELKPWMTNLTGMQATLMLNIQSHLATSKDVRQKKWYEGGLFQNQIEKSLSEELKRRGYDPNQILNK